eukprot:XP_001611932.1 hypothetical protein [Babesia bovis T2Bo]
MEFLTAELPMTPVKVVRIQLLQTLSMLVHNINNERMLYYMLSNNYMNNLVTNRNIYASDEVSSWTVSLLKTLSSLINGTTIKFFFHEGNTDFPLLEGALKFLSSSDSIKRAHAMTIVLSILRLNDPSVNLYVVSQSRVIMQLTGFLRHTWRRLDRHLHVDSNELTDKSGYIDTAIVQCDDAFQFLQDILDLGNPEISEALTQHMLAHCLFPLLGSLLSAVEWEVTALVPVTLPQELQDISILYKIYQQLLMHSGLMSIYARNKSEFFGAPISRDDCTNDVTESRRLSYFLLVHHLCSMGKGPLKRYILLLLQCPFIPRNVLEHLCHCTKQSSDYASSCEPIDTSLSIFTSMQAWDHYVFGDESNDSLSENMDISDNDYLLNIIMAEFIRLAVCELPKSDTKLKLLLNVIRHSQINPTSPLERFVASLTILQSLNVATRWVGEVTLRLPVLRLMCCVVKNGVNMLKEHNADEMPRIVDEIWFHLEAGYNMVTTLVESEMAVATPRHTEVFREEWSRPSDLESGCSTDISKDPLGELDSVDTSDPLSIFLRHVKAANLLRQCLQDLELWNKPR